MDHKGVDIRIIENKKIISIFKNMNGLNGTFTYSINNVNFIPDTMVVKSISYLSTGAETKMTSLYSTIVNDVIGSFYDFENQNNINLEFILQRPIQGTYTFNILGSNGVINSVVRAGDLFIQLEFIKYKNVKQDKIF